MSAAFGPRVGIWGTFDLADYGNLLVPRIFEHELLRRLPNARVHPYAPLGAEHPIAMDGGRPATPLGSWTPARRAQLAEQLDLVAVGGSDAIHVRDDLHRDAYAEAEAPADLEPSRFFVDGLGAELERRCPVVWHAVGVPFELDGAEATRVRDALASKRYISVHDQVSRERLLATGTDREIAVVPDPVVLVSRLFPRETLRKRVEYLRALNCYPPEERPIVVEGDAAVARALSGVTTGVPVVVVSFPPTRGDKLGSSPERPVYRMPAEVSLEDLVAAIANARAFVGSSRHGELTALSFGVPCALVGVDDPSSIAALLSDDAAVDEGALRALTDAVDAHFDTLAAIAEESWSERLAGSGSASDTAADLARALAEAERRHDALLRAYDARGDRLLAERLRLAEMLDAIEAREAIEGADVKLETLLELSEARNRLEILDAEAAAARFERDELRAQLEQAPTGNERPARFRPRA